MTASNPAVPPADVSVESRQLLLLVVCSLALVVAAFATPAATAGSTPTELPISDLFDDGEGEPADCAIGLDQHPVPGKQVTVTVLQGGEPATNVPVWFNDQRIGQTNESGQVEGQVPYTRELEVTAGMPSGGDCEFDAGPARQSGSGLAGPSSMAVHPDSGAMAASPGGVSGSTASAPSGGMSTAETGQATSNVTGSYFVFGSIDVRVDGQTDPGTDVTLVATLDGDPVPDATVTVNGVAAGTTDSNGELSIRVPDDGSEMMAVHVQRGEFESERHLPIRVLQVDVHSHGLFTFPGQNATAVASIGTEPAGNATVTVGGEQVDTTDEFGIATFELPMNPAASVTVTTADQTASTNVLSAYAPTVVAMLTAFIVFVLLPLGVFWAGGRRAITALGVLVALLLAIAGGYIVAGPTGAVVAVLGAVALLLVVAVIRRPETAGTISTSVGSHLDTFGAWVTDQTLWVATAIGSFFDQMRTRCQAIWERLRNEDRNFLGVFLSWIVSVPGKLWAVLWYVVGLPGRLLARLRTEPEPTPEEESTDNQESAEIAGSVPSIRQLWRLFASRVVPQHWPQRTPGEVSREAVESGYPADSVAELTGVFRDVEYGNHRLSDERYERARTAFQTLERTDSERSNGPDSDATRRSSGQESGTDGQEVSES